MVAICKEMLADDGVFIISVISVEAKLGINLIECRIDVIIVGSLHFEEIGGHRFYCAYSSRLLVIKVLYACSGDISSFCVLPYLQASPVVKPSILHIL